MEKKHRTTREKLELMKEIKRRNEQREKEFAEMKAREEKLLDLYIEGRISEEEFYKYLRK